MMTSSSSTKTEDRSTRVIQAYFEKPKNEYARLIQEIKNQGGLSVFEAIRIQDELLPVHSRTILRHTGVYCSGPEGKGQ